MRGFDEIHAIAAERKGGSVALEARLARPLGPEQLRATPDECWRWGSIYYNAADPALVVEKRDGPGYTLNFANPLAWPILVLIVLITVVPIVVSRRL